MNPSPQTSPQDRPALNRPTLREVSLVGTSTRQYVHFAPVDLGCVRLLAEARQIRRAEVALRP